MLQPCCVLVHNSQASIHITSFPWTGNSGFPLVLWLEIWTLRCWELPDSPNLPSDIRTQRLLKPMWALLLFIKFWKLWIVPQSCNLPRGLTLLREMQNKKKSMKNKQGKWTQVDCHFESYRCVLDTGGFGLDYVNNFPEDGQTYWSPSNEQHLLYSAPSVFDLTLSRPAEAHSRTRARAGLAFTQHSLFFWDAPWWNWAMEL